MVDEKNGAVGASGESPAEPATPAAAEEASDRTPDTPPAKRSKRGWIVAGVIVAVVLVAGIGAWVWHEQPSFCNAVCHSPMDRYVESYGEGDPGKLVTQHAAAGDTCLSCHEAEFTTQVSEVMAWASDSYPVGEDGMLATGKEFATEEFCARSGCHDMQDVVASTWGFEGNDEKYNPHSSHQDNALECSDCHKVHETSELYCAKCHDLNLPEGWEATHE
ncbi:hypothetical protein C1878_11955 [Gordonibacter sp. 28C]|uniref:cytochrome c3 family protein n=1 Tax=Gordonibacter sp. 28C TaxID=2078569 RepID=UPI000DF81138|nr:cytochrome c3 family protein [Gordonibacter sp. 28C]RDB61420.1 hypothetical protein C1878_11955 [Gordonibacter sp. 28C]